MPESMAPEDLGMNRGDDMKGKCSEVRWLQFHHAIPLVIGESSGVRGVRTEWTEVLSLARVSPDFT